MSAARPTVVVLMMLVSMTGFARGESAPAPAQGLTNAAPLVRIYQDIMDARFEQADQQIRQGCGGAPPVACEIMGTVLTWWRIQMDPAARTLDAQVRAGVDGAIADADAWTRREPQRGEAWFYLGAAYAVRVQFRALRYERMAAARDGKRIKDALERALALDPSINDGYFGIGLYHYYAAIAPTALKLLRFLLLLPGGDRVQGLAEMEKTRERGELLRAEADYQLHLLYLWYEKQPARALDLLRSLHAAFPHNPLFLARIADVQDVYFHDAAASLATWQLLLRDAQARRVSVPEIADTWARIGIGAQYEALGESDRAIEHLQPIVDARPVAPAGGLARAALLLGKAYDRLGDRFRAMAQYRLAVTVALVDDPDNDPDKVRASAKEQMQRAPDARRAEAYKLSLDGWRLFERQSYAQAALALEQSLATNPADPIAHYRYGRVLQARDSDDPRALAEFEQAIASRPLPPAAILADAYYGAARVLERQGERARAIEMYQTVGRLSGADVRTRDAAAKSLARLRTTGSRHTR
ncbi:MAG: tetratricopeptide repeat protein [Bacteroidales bacterium]